METERPMEPEPEEEESNTVGDTSPAEPPVNQGGGGSTVDSDI